MGVSPVHRSSYQFGRWNLASGCEYELMGGEDSVVPFCAASADGNRKALCSAGCPWLPGVQPKHCMNSSQMPVQISVR